MHTRHILGQRLKNPPLHRKSGSIVLCLMVNLGLTLSLASDYGAAVWTKTQADGVWQTVKIIVGANAQCKKKQNAIRSKRLLSRPCFLNV